jgi:acyl carrier protein
MSAPNTGTVQAELQEWLCTFLAAELRVPGGIIEPTTPMADYGLDSVTAFALLTDIEERVGFELDPNALWDYPTVADFSVFLADELAAAPTG